MDGPSGCGGAEVGPRLTDPSDPPAEPPADGGRGDLADGEGAPGDAAAREGTPAADTPTEGPAGVRKGEWVGRFKTPGKVLCYNCWSDSHGVDHCPLPLFCSRCGGSNHTAQVCGVTERGTQPTGSCYNCGAEDHSLKKCPHSLFCKYCGRPGHTRNVCWREDPTRKSGHKVRREKPAEPAAPLPPPLPTSDPAPPEPADPLAEDLLGAFHGGPGRHRKRPADFMEELRRFVARVDGLSSRPDDAGHEAATTGGALTASSSAGTVAAPAGDDRRARCYNCKSLDHLAKDCLRKLFCTRCHTEGHTANRCKTCHNCGEHHLLKRCPKPLRCTRCLLSGHTANRCRKRTEEEERAARCLRRSTWYGLTVKGFADPLTDPEVVAALRALVSIPAAADTAVVRPAPGGDAAPLLCVVLLPTADQRDATVCAVNDLLPAPVPPLVARSVTAAEVGALLPEPDPPPPAPEPPAVPVAPPGVSPADAMDLDAADEAEGVATGGFPDITDASARRGREGPDGDDGGERRAGKRARIGGANAAGGDLSGMPRSSSPRPGSVEVASSTDAGEPADTGALSGDLRPPQTPRSPPPYDDSGDDNLIAPDEEDFSADGLLGESSGAPSDPPAAPAAAPSLDGLSAEPTVDPNTPYY